MSDKTVDELINELKKKDVVNKELYDLLAKIIEKPKSRIPKSKKNIFGEVYIPEEELIGSFKQTPSITGYKQYAYYANKYKIPLSKDGHKKTIKELSESIHKYENKNRTKLIKKGIDFNTGQYGMYIIE